MNGHVRGYITAVLGVTTVLALTTPLFSIEASDAPTERGTTLGVRLREGVLAFDSMSSLEKTLRRLQARPDAADSWVAQFRGFRSLRASRVQFDVEGAVASEQALAAADDLLASVLNSEGEVVVGDDAYKLAGDRLLIQRRYAARRTPLDRLWASEDVVATSEVHPVRVQSAPLVALASDGDSCYAYYDFRGSKKRLKGEVWTSSVGPFYSSAGARTRHQQRRLGVWWADKAPQVRLNVDGVIRQYIYGGGYVEEDVHFDTGILNDDSGDAETFEFCLNVPCQFEIVNMASTHWAIGDDGNEHQCQLNF